MLGPDYVSIEPGTNSFPLPGQLARQRWLSMWTRTAEEKVLHRWPQSVEMAPHRGDGRRNAPTISHHNGAIVVRRYDSLSDPSLLPGSAFWLGVEQ